MARIQIIAECRRDTRHNFSLSRTIASRKRCNLRSLPNTSRDVATRNGLSSHDVHVIGDYSYDDVFNATPESH
jgi:hypothetical protein